MTRPQQKAIGETAARIVDVPARELRASGLAVAVGLHPIDRGTRVEMRSRRATGDGARGAATRRTRI